MGLSESVLNKIKKKIWETNYQTFHNLKIVAFNVKKLKMNLTRINHKLHLVNPINKYLNNNMKK